MGDRCVLVPHRCNGARGQGVHLLRKRSNALRHASSEAIVQRYLSKPRLIGGYKFDLRLFVLISSWEPLTAYIWREGLVRFCAKPFNTKRDSLRDRSAHLTNSSVNAKHRNYQSASSADEDGGANSKWTLSALKRRLESSKEHEFHFDTDVWPSIVDAIIKTLISAEEKQNGLVRAYLPERKSCFELYGFDCMLDHNLKPWILEVPPLIVSFCACFILCVYFRQLHRTSMLPVLVGSGEHVARIKYTNCFG